MPSALTTEAILNLPPAITFAVAALYAVLLWIRLARAHTRYRAIPALEPAPVSASLPDCMVVIPARNEAATIADCVKSLPSDSVIVVDDHSEDQTAKIATEAGAGVLPAPELPRDAVGKSHACMVGAEPLTSRWILFADADTRFEKGFLDSLLAYADAKGLHFASIQLEPEPRSISGNIIVPYARALYFSAIDPNADLQASFHGQCILAKREAYEFVGGHGSVIQRLNEDFWIAFIALRHRMQIGILRAGTLGHALTDSGSVTESLARQAARFNLLEKRVAVNVVLNGFLATLWFPVAVFALLAGQPAAAVLAALSPMLVLRKWYRGWGTALLAPLFILLAFPVLLKTLLATLASSPLKWRGRPIATA